MVIFTVTGLMKEHACYYDFIDSVYEKTLAAVKEQADKDGIPYGYVQVTSSSYYYN